MKVTIASTPRKCNINFMCIPTKLSDQLVRYLTACGIIQDLLWGWRNVRVQVGIFSLLYSEGESDSGKLSRELECKIVNAFSHGEIYPISTDDLIN